MYIHGGRVLDEHPQIQTTLDTIGFANRIGVVIVAVVIVSIVFGYGG